jgi:adenine-specific DNA-methyltransferase
MRFIGCKNNILEQIYEFILSKKIYGGTFFDIFSGTTSVASFFKRKGYRVISNDNLYFSYVLQKAYIETNAQPDFSRLLKMVKLPPNGETAPLNKVIKYLNSLNGNKGFVYKNYTDKGTQGSEHIRMYFQSDNGGRIDGVRQKIEEWNGSGLLLESEYFLLLASLIEAVPSISNISGTYGAFLKFWERRTFNPLMLKVPEIIINSYKDNKAFNEDGTDLCKNIECDILYIDPPYNARQYAPNYHVLETVARYDNPVVSGKSGMRNYEKMKSQFCKRQTAIEALKKIVTTGKYKHLILSYNNEGLMTDRDIRQALASAGATVEKEVIEYRRYKSHSHGDNGKKKVNELLYYINNGR